MPERVGSNEWLGRDGRILGRMADRPTRAKTIGFNSMTPIVVSRSRACKRFRCASNCRRSSLPRDLGTNRSGTAFRDSKARHELSAPPENAKRSRCVSSCGSAALPRDPMTSRSGTACRDSEARLELSAPPANAEGHERIMQAIRFASACRRSSFPHDEPKRHGFS